MINSQEFTSIINDPVFTPNLVEQIEAVAEFQHHTERFVDDVINGVHRSAVLQGPPGLGKSHAVARSLANAGRVQGRDFVIVKGAITPFKLFQLLYVYRREGQLVVLDDCDSILLEERGLEVLKAATDDQFRKVSWRGAALSYNGERVDDFVFNGSIIICTNLSLRTYTGSRRDRQAAALLSRMVVWDLQLRTRERCYAQVFHMVVNEDYLSVSAATALTTDQKRDLLTFLLRHLDDVQNLDLRQPQILAREIVANPQSWQQRAFHILSGGARHE